MYKRKIFNLILATYLALINVFIFVGKVYAENAQIYLAQEHKLNLERATKVRALENFFDSYNSPLAKYSETFVAVADKYDIDYKLLPAISCMESTCAKFIIENSYNPFGWGIYGNSSVYFSSFGEAIETVGKGISDIYVFKGYDTPEKMAPIYTPPNHVNWLVGVKYFMNEINSNYILVSAF